MDLFKKLARASNRGSGLRLSAAEVSLLADAFEGAPDPNAPRRAVEVREGKSDALVISDRGTYLTRARHQ